MNYIEGGTTGGVPIGPARPAKLHPTGSPHSSLCPSSPFPSFTFTFPLPFLSFPFLCGWFRGPALNEGASHLPYTSRPNGQPPPAASVARPGSARSLWPACRALWPPSPHGLSCLPAEERERPAKKKKKARGAEFRVSWILSLIRSHLGNRLLLFVSLLVRGGGGALYILANPVAIVRSFGVLRAAELHFFEPGSTSCLTMPKRWARVLRFAHPIRSVLLLLAAS